MLKRSMVLMMVLVLVVSFSVVALAEDVDGKAPNNEAGVEILVEHDGDSCILFEEEAVNEAAGELGVNPIHVAGN